jgi:uncharacterized membrane protein/glutaredoxin
MGGWYVLGGFPPKQRCCPGFKMWKKTNMKNTSIKKIPLFFILFLAFCVSPARAQAQQPVVRAVMFWMAGCPHCEDVIANVLPPLREKYGAQFDLFMIEVKSTQDVDNLYKIAASYKITKEQTGVPFLILGDQVLIGSDQVHKQLPTLIDDYLTRGGLDFPTNPILADLLPTPSPASPATLSLPTITQAVDSPQTESAPHNNGFTLAAVVMVGMIVVILYVLISLLTGKFFFRAAWIAQRAAIPFVALIGLGVAAYLTYVETQSVKAFCGPVGDCNAVQSSSYARIWGILPVGVLGAFGYIAILAAWWSARKNWGWLSVYAPIALFGIALFGTIFSVYLTYLEIYVIKAVCIWCISSAILITLLLLFSLEPALRAFSSSDDDEEENL